MNIEDYELSDQGPGRQFRKTRKSYNTPGEAHFLRFSCFQQQSFLNSDRSRQWLVDSINRACTRHNLALWAYVFMPEHVHLIIFPWEADYDMGAILACIKRPVTERAIEFMEASDRPASAWTKFYQVRRSGEKHFRFWQVGGGYDRNLLSPEEIWEKIDYIHKNPVTAQLCENPEDWKWSSAADYFGVRLGPLKISFDSLPTRPS